jgi:hypothetical protein
VCRPHAQAIHTGALAPAVHTNADSITLAVLKTGYASRLDEFERSLRRVSRVFPLGPCLEKVTEKLCVIRARHAPSGRLAHLSFDAAGGVSVHGPEGSSAHGTSRSGASALLGRAPSGA